MLRPHFRLIHQRLSLLLVLAGPISCNDDGGVEATPLTAVTREIRNGAPAPELAEVAAMVRDGKVFCSAVMVSPTEALTAAHCVERPGFSLQVQTAQGTAPPMTPIAVRAHPRYVAGSEVDIAVVLLASPQGLPVSISDEAPSVGSLVRLSGYGREASDGMAGARQSGQARIRALSPTVMDLEAAPAQACFGDSGGAVFHETGSGRALTGILMEGDDRCDAISRAVRVDAYRESFIVPALAQLRATGASIGQRCTGDLDCQTGYCLEQQGERFCSGACFPSDARGCPTGFVCQGSMPGSPGLFECARPSEEASGGCSMAPRPGQRFPGRSTLALLCLLAGLLWRSRPGRRDRHPAQRMRPQRIRQ
jgi:hypothetical protein